MSKPEATITDTVRERADALLVKMSDAVGRAEWKLAIDLGSEFRSILQTELQFRDARRGQA